MYHDQSPSRRSTCCERDDGRTLYVMQLSVEVKILLESPALLRNRHHDAYYRDRPSTFSCTLRRSSRQQSSLRGLVEAKLPKEAMVSGIFTATNSHQLGYFGAASL